MYVYIHIYIYVYLHVCMNVINVCMYVCMYVCMHAFMYVYVCIHTYIQGRGQKVGLWPSPDPETKARGKTRMHHPTSIVQLVGVYSMIIKMTVQLVGVLYDRKDYCPPTPKPKEEGKPA